MRPARAHRAAIAAMAMVAVLSSANIGGAHPPLPSSTSQTVTGLVSEVEGEFRMAKNAQGEDVLKLVDKSYVVITRSGQEVHLTLTPGTKVPARANPGDRIEATLSRQGQTLSITLIR